MKKKSEPVILIRTDGNNKIGFGHIYRTIALSKELKKLGFKICFLTSNNKIILDKIKKYGKYYLTNNKKDFEISLIKKINPDIVIIDLLEKFFPFGINYFKSLNKMDIFIVTIDYVGQENKFADIGIHSLFGPQKFRAKKFMFVIWELKK